MKKLERERRDIVALPESSKICRRHLTTREAATYCGFKCGSALRKARLEGRIVGAGRRGGTGPWMWRVQDLDRFLRGEAPSSEASARVLAERSGAPPHGGAHEDQAERLEVNE